MNRFSKVLFTTCSLVAMGGTALAQDPPPAGEEGATTEGEVGAEVGGEVGTTGADASVSATAAAPTAWTTEIFKRPGVMKKGMLRPEATFGFSRLTIPAAPPLIPESTSFNNGGLQIGAGYGVSDKLELGASYAITLFEEFEAKGPLSIYGAFNIMQNEKLRVIGVGNFTYDLASEVAGLSAGLFARYDINDKMGVYTGSYTGGAPGGGHLNVTLAAPDPDAAGPAEAVKPITFDVPVGFGFQVNPKLYAFAETQLASFNISNSANAFIFADITPLRLGGFYGISPTMELGVALDMPSVEDVGDLFAILVTGRMFMGDAVKAAPAAATPPPM